MRFIFVGLAWPRSNRVNWRNIKELLVAWIKAFRATAWHPRFIITAVCNYIISIIIRHESSFFESTVRKTSHHFEPWTKGVYIIPSMDRGFWITARVSNNVDCLSYDLYFVPFGFWWMGILEMTFTVMFVWRWQDAGCGGKGGSAMSRRWRSWLVFTAVRNQDSDAHVQWGMWLPCLSDSRVVGVGFWWFSLKLGRKLLRDEGSSMIKLIEKVWNGI